jgi:hypothetical protein
LFDHQSSISKYLVVLRPCHEISLNDNLFVINSRELAIDCHNFPIYPHQVSINPSDLTINYLKH